MYGIYKKGQNLASTLPELRPHTNSIPAAASPAKPSLPRSAQNFLPPNFYKSKPHDLITSSITNTTPSRKADDLTY